jgi:hypothetical protein
MISVWKVTKHYRYRTATLKRFTNLPAEPFSGFHQECARKAIELKGGGMPDNHEMYIVKASYRIGCTPDEFVVWFHDGTMAVGEVADIDEKGYDYD